MSAKISKDRENAELFFDYGIHLPTRTLYIGSEEYNDEGGETGVDFKMAEKVIKGLHLLEASAPDGNQPITIIMNNPGGDCTHGLAIYDTIRQCKNHVTVKARGNCCSMAGYILQGADERQISKNAILMFHIGYDGHGTNHPKIIEKWVEFGKKLRKKLDSILLEKINEKRDRENKAHMSKAYFEKLNDFDTILSADQAVEWGLADKIEE